MIGEVVCKLRRKFLKKLLVGYLASIVFWPIWKEIDGRISSLFILISCMVDYQLLHIHEENMGCAIIGVF